MRGRYVSWLVTLAWASVSFADEVVERCELGHGHVVQLTARSQPTEVGSHYSLELDGARRRDFDVQGDLTQGTCLNGLYLVTIDTGAVKETGVAVRLDPTTHAPEVLHFAQKGRPRFAQLGGPRFAIIFDSDGLRADGAPFLRVTAGNATSEPLQRVPKSGLTELHASARQRPP